MMLKFSAIVALAVVTSSAFSFQASGHRSAPAEPESLLGTNGAPQYSILNINNLTTWCRYDGLSNFSPHSQEGLHYPRGTGNVIYKDGIVWGAKAYLDSAHTHTPASQLVRVGGGTYGIGTIAGWVGGLGEMAVAKSPSDPDVHIYRIRRDYRALRYGTGDYTTDLRRDAGDMNEILYTEASDGQIEQLYAQYETDWNTWPVEHGAPYIERNGVPGFQRPPAFSPLFTQDSLAPGHYDEPGIAGADPDHPADQVLWMVYNDLNQSVALGFASSRSLGLEIQKTVWGYKSSAAEGNMYFNRYRFINKGGVDTSGTGTMGSFFLDSMYVCQWSDPDLGDFADDLGGCDTNLQVGFIYNGNAADEIFKQYGLAPPAFGYVLLQGPIVPSVGQNGTFNFEHRDGFANRRMDSFAVWGAGDPYADPPNGEPGGYAATTGQWWKVIRGFAPIGTLSSADQPYYVPPGANPKFMHSGDPASHTGDLDGLGTSSAPPPGDRSILLSTGPFSLAPGDTQEVIIAGVAGLGADRLSGVSVMKYNAKAARADHGRLYVPPRPPEQPDLHAIELNQTIVLDWGSDAAKVKQIEQDVVAGEYAFEGYTVYQLPRKNSALTDGVRIATFDKVNGVTRILGEQFDWATGALTSVLLQEGSDRGIKRFLKISIDQLSDTWGAKLRNGQEYYFAVTAYNYSAVGESLPISMESGFTVIAAKPRVPFGIVTSSASGDSIHVAHIAGSGTGRVNVLVLDPLQSTGETYQVHFDTSLGAVRWNLLNVSTNTAILSGQEYDSIGTFVDGGVLLTVLPADGQFMTTDVFQYSLPSVTKGLAVDKASAHRVSVFPNPYYASRSQETTNWRHFVTFNNLPPKVTIRIFNLAGHLVRTLEKNDPSQFLEWDLANQDNWQVASGMYICYIEMPDIGETKVLKLAVIQPQGVMR